MNDDDLIRRGDAALAVLQNFTETAQLEAINTIPAAQVTVKQLEWHKSIIVAWNEDWHTVPTGYTVRCADENGWKWSTSGAFGYEYSPEAAKAAAQADYEARVLAALEPAPVTLADAAKGPRIVTLHTAGRFGVCIGGRWDGWVMVQHPDGYWVSHHKPDPVDPSIPAMRAIEGASHE